MASTNIKKQVEFYFSDSNFRKDTFLRTAADSDPEGFVPIKILLTFNKLKALTTVEEDVAAAIEGSSTVVLNDSRDKIRRASPLPGNDDTKIRTLYVKGYPADDEDVTIESISEQFSAYGPVTFVRLRKDFDTKKFKGSAFVEFESPESVTRAYKAAYGDDGKTVLLSFKGAPLLCILPFTEWMAKKQAKTEQRKSAKAQPTSEKNEVATDKNVETESTVEFTPGLIVKVGDLPAEATLFEIKDLFKAIADVKYVEFKTGTDVAYIRVADTVSSEKILKSLSDGLRYSEGGKVLSGSLLSGTEETSYWKKISAESKKRVVGGKRGKWNTSNKRRRT